MIVLKAVNRTGDSRNTYPAGRSESFELDAYLITAAAYTAAAGKTVQLADYFQRVSFVL